MGSESPDAVLIQHLGKQYVTSQGRKVDALVDVSLTVPKGQLFALLGPNGAGKTTLFSVLTTLRRPTSGQALVLGFNALTERPAVRERIGIVFQDPAIDQKLTCFKNLLLMGRLYGLSSKDAHLRSREVLGDLGLADKGSRTPRELSGGERRRLELARALIPSPELLFLDEATLGLDVDARRSFWAVIRRFTAAGSTVFFTTHYMEEADVADRIALIDLGRIVAIGSPDELKSRLGQGLIVLQTDDDERAIAWLSSNGRKAYRASDGVYFSDPDPAATLPWALRGLPSTVRRAEVRLPSLEDVFLSLTGRKLQEAARGEAARR